MTDDELYHILSNTQDVRIMFGGKVYSHADLEREHRAIEDAWKTGVI